MQPCAELNVASECAMCASTMKCNPAASDFHTILHRHDKSQHFRSRSSQTAVCLAGEARTILSSRVREMQLRNLVTPLHADLFLVLSPMTRPDDGRNGWTPSSLRLIEESMDPISVVVAKDDQILGALSRLGLAPAERKQVTTCALAQPLPSSPANRGDADFRSWFQVGACAPQLSLALRHRACLALIEHAEKQRHALP